MHVKHIVGRPFGDKVIADLKKQSPFKIVESKGLAGFEVDINNKKNVISSAEATALIFKKLKGWYFVDGTLYSAFKPCLDFEYVHVVSLFLYMTSEFYIL